VLFVVAFVGLLLLPLCFWDFLFFQLWYLLVKALALAETGVELAAFWTAVEAAVDVYFPLVETSGEADAVTARKRAVM